ncbi:MAG TPA: hypothetical protein VM597_39245, partial [Gemmataceae bacterium]|nr:hypothetical protein [Gemmataceae bacterium]
VLSMILKPRMRTDRPIPVTTDSGWKEKNPPASRAAKPLVVEAGIHKVRAAFEVSRGGNAVRLASNAAEVAVAK